MRQAHLLLITGLPGTGKSTLARALAARYRIPILCKDTIKEPLLDVLGATDRHESRRLSDASFAVMFALARDALRAGTDLILEGNFRPGEHEAALEALILDSARPRSGVASDAQHPAASLAPIDEHLTPAAAHSTHFDERLTPGAARSTPIDEHLTPATARSTLMNERLTPAAAHSTPIDECLAAAPLTPASARPPQPPNLRLAQILCRTSEPVRLARLKARSTDPTRHPGHRDAHLATATPPPQLEFLALPGERLVFDSDARSATEVDPSRLRHLLDTLDHWQHAHAHL